MPFQYVQYDRSCQLNKQLADLWKKTNYAPSLASQKLAKHISWKYKPFFTKLEIVKTEKRIIGSCGAIDLDIYARKKILKGRWGVDSLVDKDYAQFYPFIFSGVYRKIFNPIIQGDFDLAFSFPSNQSINFFLRTGWGKINRAIIFSKILKPKTIIYPLYKKGISIENIKRFPPSINPFLVGVLKKMDLICFRNADFLNWRYAGCPTHNYELYLVKLKNKTIGYFILRLEKKGNLNIGYIIDILCNLEITRRLDILISQAEHIFLSKKIDIIHTLATHEIHQKALIKTNFFIKKRVNFVYFIKKRHHLKNLKKREKHWFFTMGDGDFEMED